MKKKFPTPIFICKKNNNFRGKNLYFFHEYIGNIFPLVITHPCPWITS